MTVEVKIKRSEVVKSKILHAAAKLFLEKGYAESTVKEIAQVAGVSLGSLTFAFKNKENILLVHFGRGFWSGHFESESDKIIPSLWQRQSQLSYFVADTITVDQQSKNNLQDWLVRFLISIGYEQTAGPEVKLRWHEKSCGSSQMKQIERKKSSRC